MFARRSKDLFHLLNLSRCSNAQILNITRAIEYVQRKKITKNKTYAQFKPQLLIIIRKIKPIKCAYG